MLLSCMGRGFQGGSIVCSRVMVQLMEKNIVTMLYFGAAIFVFSTHGSVGGTVQSCVVLYAPVRVAFLHSAQSLGRAGCRVDFNFCHLGYSSPKMQLVHGSLLRLRTIHVFTLGVSCSDPTIFSFKKCGQN